MSSIASHESGILTTKNEAQNSQEQSEQNLLSLELPVVRAQSRANRSNDLSGMGVTVMSVSKAMFSPGS